jgi:hypothetical protein
MTNTAEHLNTKYVEYQFINIVKCQESNQPNINSTIKVAAMDAVKLNELNENSDTKSESI